MFARRLAAGSRASARAVDRSGDGSRGPGPGGGFVRHRLDHPAAGVEGRWYLAQAIGPAEGAARAGVRPAPRPRRRRPRPDRRSRRRRCWTTASWLSASLTWRVTWHCRQKDPSHLQHAGRTWWASCATGGERKGWDAGRTDAAVRIMAWRRSLCFGAVEAALGQGPERGGPFAGAARRRSPYSRRAIALLDEVQLAAALTWRTAPYECGRHSRTSYSAAIEQVAGLL